MNWEVRIAKGVKKQIRKFPQNDKKRILMILRDFEIDPWIGSIVKIDEYENKWRRRVGSYRIFYTVHMRIKVIEIINIKRRTSKTY